MSKWLVRFAAVLGVLSLDGGVVGQGVVEGRELIASCGSCEFYLAGVPAVNATVSRTGSCSGDCSGLYLHWRSIVQIANGTFDGLSGLQTLYLYDNQLSSLSVGLFDGLSGLQTLRLYGNQLSSL